MTKVDPLNEVEKKRKKKEKKKKNQQDTINDARSKSRRKS